MNTEQDFNTVKKGIVRAIKNLYKEASNAKDIVELTSTILGVAVIAIEEAKNQFGSEKIAELFATVRPELDRIKRGQQA